MRGKAAQEIKVGAGKSGICEVCLSPHSMKGYSTIMGVSTTYKLDCRARLRWEVGTVSKRRFAISKYQNRPVTLGIGVDHEFLWRSAKALFLLENNLGRLGNVEALPTSD